MTHTPKVFKTETITGKACYKLSGITGATIETGGTSFLVRFAPGVVSDTGTFLNYSYATHEQAQMEFDRLTDLLASCED